MVKFYADESEDQHVITLAGWMASPTGWRHMRKRWRGMLREFDVSELHMADLMTSRNPSTEYGAWTQAKRDDFLDAAVTIIEKNGGLMFSVACSIALNAAIARKYWPWKQAFATVGGLSYGVFPAARQAEFIFDEKEKVKGFVTSAYKAARKEHEGFRRWAHFKEPTFQTTLRTLPLQAADMLAWGLRRSTSDRLKGHPSPLRPWVERLRAGCRDTRWRCVDYDAWLEIKRDVDAGLSFHAAWNRQVSNPHAREF